METQDRKISELEQITTFVGGELLLLADSGKNRSITTANFGNAILAKASGSDVKMAGGKLTVTDSAKRAVFDDHWRTAGGGRDGDYYTMNGLTDITYEQACAVLFSPPHVNRIAAPLARTNAAFGSPLTMWHGANDLADMQDFCCNNGVIEVVKLADDSTTIYVSSLSHFARAAVKLKRVIGVINVGVNPNTPLMNAFYNAKALEEVRITKLRGDISFGDSPNLSLASLQYLIANANAGPFTVTVHADVYARLTDGLIAEAAIKQITFVTP